MNPQTPPPNQATPPQPDPALPPSPDVQAPPSAPQSAPSFEPAPVPELSVAETAEQAIRHPQLVTPKGKPKTASTQNSLLISEIRDGMVIMRDGSLRSVILCQSINFDLMSPGEREAVEQSYQGFLNSLYFSVQIFIRSRRVDLGKYIDNLAKIHKDQDNILLSLLMEDYIAYVQYLIQSSNIMNKQFYIVVPYFPTLASSGGIAAGSRKLTALFSSKPKTIVINETNFKEYKTELTQAVQVVLNGLTQMNVQAVPLNTQELIELYYTVYNPQTAESEKLIDINELEAPIISKGTGETPSYKSGAL